MMLTNILFLAALLLICVGIYWFARGVAELLDGWTVARLSERRGGPLRRLRGNRGE